MAILVDFNNVSQRLKDFEAEGFEFRYQESPLLRGLAYTLISLEWEGTPSILSDAFTPGDNDQHGFELTLSRLGYQCRTTEFKRAVVEGLKAARLPCFIELDKLSAVLLEVEGNNAVLFDYRNNNTISIPIDGLNFSLTIISEYSKLFREPPPETQDKSNWVKYTFYRYSKEQMMRSFTLLGLEKFFEQGLETHINTEMLAHLPSGLLQRLRLAIGLADMSQKIILIDEPLIGVEIEHATYINQLFAGVLRDKTVIYTTVAPTLISSATHCLLLDKDGSQKYFGTPDKVMNAMGT